VDPLSACRTGFPVLRIPICTAGVQETGWGRLVDLITCAVYSINKQSDITFIAKNTVLCSSPPRDHGIPLRNTDSEARLPESIAAAGENGAGRDKATGRSVKLYRGNKRLSG
jgi:hypothetical protein